MKLKLLLINKVSDETYYSVHIVSSTSAYYIHYLIIKEEENIYNKVNEYINSDIFKYMMIEKGYKGFNIKDYNTFDFTTITINDNE